MRVILHLIRSPLRMTRIARKDNRRRIKQDLLKIKKVFAQEREDTQQMLITYRRFTLGTASKEDMKEANKQLADLVKGLGIGVFAILPFAPLTIPAIIMLGKRFDINVLPSAFYEKEGSPAADADTPAPQGK